MVRISIDTLLVAGSEYAFGKHQYIRYIRNVPRLKNLSSSLELRLAL